MSQQSEIQTTKLSNGCEIPVVGLGTFRAEDEAQLTKAIKAAVKAGYRHFDCAWAYQNEKVVGKALKECIAESNGALKRGDLFITSKLWNSFHSKERAHICLDETLTNLDLGYLDLYLIHWPQGLKEGGEPFPSEYSDIHYLETWKAMEEFHKQGKVKAIGVSNFNNEQLKDVLDHCSIKPAVNQFEINPYNQSTEWVQFCQKNGVAVEGYAPLGSADALKDKNVPKLIENPVLIEIGKKYNKSAPQVIVRWGIQLGIIVLAKSVTPERIVDNINVFDFTLSDEDMQKIKALNINARTYPEPQVADHPLYPFKSETKKQ